MTEKKQMQDTALLKKDTFVHFLRASVSVHDRLDFFLYTYLISDFIEGAMSFWLLFLESMQFFFSLVFLPRRQMGQKYCSLFK